MLKMGQVLLQLVCKAEVLVQRAVHHCKIRSSQEKKNSQAKLDRPV
jgi:hypothetical protein